MPVRVFAFDGEGNVAVKQLLVVPGVAEKFVSHAMANGLAESSARQFYAGYEGFYPGGAELLLFCVELNAKNAAIFSELYRNISGDRQVIDKSGVLPEAAKLCLRVRLSRKVLHAKRGGLVFPY